MKPLVAPEDLAAQANNKNQPKNLKTDENYCPNGRSRLQTKATYPNRTETAHSYRRKAYCTAVGRGYRERLRR
jgi:hypothetical protein